MALHRLDVVLTDRPVNPGTSLRLFSHELGTYQVGFFGKENFVEEYKQSLLNDRELGGNAFEKTMKTANFAYTHFADGDVQNLLAQTGLNCHPKVVKMFYSIGKLLFQFFQCS